jgi:hypothetical protein
MNTGRGGPQASRVGFAGLGCALLVASAVAAMPAAARSGYAPDTCLNGYVWRGAVDSDHVCVTSAVRAQTAYDNSQAAARRNPNGGPYGPDTCLQGFVWRGAVAGDHVCVTPAARDQVLRDNAQAGPRRNEVRLWIRSYVPDHVWCDGDTCWRSSDDAPRYLVRADRINVGRAYLGLYRSNGERIRYWWVPVERHKSAPGGWVSYRTDRLKCAGAPNAYFRLRDPSSGIWSSRMPVATGCLTL